MSRTELFWGAAAVLACLAPAAAAASSLRADGGAAAAAHTDDGVGTKTLTPGPGSLEIVVGASATDSVTDNLPPFQTWDMAAVVAGIGSARYGALAGSAFAEASSLPQNFSLLAGGEAQVIPGYTDGALIRSDTLADDTPVTLTFRMTLDGTAFHTTDEPAVVNPDGTGAGARYEVELRDLDAPTQLPTTGALVINSRGVSETARVIEIDTAIGHRVELAADLYLAAGVQVDFEVLQFSDGSAEVSAGQTGKLFYEPAGDVQLETESGHDYAAPEPGRVWLTLAATLALWGRRVRLRLARGRVVRGAAAVALVCLAPAAAAAGGLRATAVHNSLVYNTADAGSSLLTPGPGSLEITAGTAASEAVVTPPDVWEGEALGSASGTARYGSLAGRAHAEASFLPTCHCLNLFARVLVSVRPGYTDGAQVLSDTLAPGTPVTLRFRMALDATAIHFVDPPNGVGPTGAGAGYEVVLRDVDDLTAPLAQRTLAVDSSGLQLTSATLELGTAIGHRIELVADLRVGAQVDVDYYINGVSQGSADVLAEQTAGLFYEPSGDVRLETDSGHDYAVPEPGRATLLGLAAAALLLRRGRHPRGAEALAG